MPLEDIRALINLPKIRQFNEGYAAGMVNAVSRDEIETIVRILSTRPVDEWLADPQLQYACGLLAGWLPVESYREVQALLQQSQSQG